MSIRVSIVVPTYKRPHLLDRCLGALFAQDYPASAYEIVVVDDAGDDETYRRVQWWRNKPGERAPIRYLRVRGQHGPAAARNIGWRAARAPVIAFTDDDCVPLPDWLREGMAALRVRDAAVWGRIAVPVPPDPTDYESDAARLASAGFVTANCFCRRQVLAGIGGLDENFTAAWREDSDLYFSLLERGLRVSQAPRATVIHPIRPGAWGASLKQQRKIQYDALLYKKHPALYRARVRRSPRWDYYATNLLLVGSAVGLVTGIEPLAIGAGAAWSGITTRFCWARLRRTSRRLSHIAEMAVTSALIPPIAVFWRFVGAVRFRVLFF